VEPLGSLWVASGWLPGAYRLATRWPEGSLKVALGGLSRFCFLFSAFCFRSAAALPGIALAPVFPLLNARPLALGCCKRFIFRVFGAFRGWGCRSWPETKAKGVIAEVLLRRERRAGTWKQRAETGPAYCWAKIENAGVEPRRPCRQRLKLIAVGSR
jgi:hypothetical protein